MISAFVPPPSLHSIYIWTLLPLWAMHTDAYILYVWRLIYVVLVHGHWTAEQAGVLTFMLMFVFFHIYSYEVVPFRPTCTSNALSHLALLVVVLKQFASHASFSRSVSACAECPLLVIYPCACCSVKVKVMHASHRVPLLVLFLCWVPLLVICPSKCCSVKQFTSHACLSRSASLNQPAPVWRA